MKTHTIQSITRRAMSAAKAAKKAFAGYETGSGLEMYLAAIRKLDRVEDDVRFLEDYSAAYAVIFGVKAAIRMSWEAAVAEARERNTMKAEAMNLALMQARRESFASRGNWNLSGSR